MSNYKYQIDDRTQAKAGLISLSVVTLLWVILFVFFYINYNDYSEVVYSVKYQTNADRGWAPMIVGWGYFGIPLFLIGIFLLAMSRDYKQISFGVSEDGVFINQDMIKASFVEKENIKEVEVTDIAIRIKLIDYSNLIKNQFFLFRYFIKKKSINNEDFLLVGITDFENDKGKEAADFLKSFVN